MPPEQADMTNKLSIRAKSLNLDLVGEPEYILRAYDAIHPVLVERFEESVEGVLDEADDLRSSQVKTMPLHRVSEPERAEEEPEPAPRAPEPAGPHHINVVVCNEVYNKIYLVERSELKSSVFSRAIDLDAVHRIYVNRAQRERFQSFFEFGKVLWRELTTAGKAAVKKGT
jgi:hypothetical protein